MKIKISKSDPFLDMVVRIASMYRNLDTKVLEVYPKYLASSKYSLPKACFFNAQKYVQAHPDCKYVLGVVSLYDIPIEHAWVKLANGNYIDTTLNDSLRYVSVIELNLATIALCQKSLPKNQKIGYLDLATLNRI